MITNVHNLLSVYFAWLRSGFMWYYDTHAIAIPITMGSLFLLIGTVAAFISGYKEEWTELQDGKNWFAIAIISVLGALVIPLGAILIGFVLPFAVGISIPVSVVSGLGYLTKRIVRKFKPVPRHRPLNATERAALDAQMTRANHRHPDMAFNDSEMQIRNDLKENR